MIRDILVPTDFSNDAYNALYYATQLFKKQKCRFHILHAFDNHSHFRKEFRGTRTIQKFQEFLSSRTAECLRETYHRIIGDTEKNPLHEIITVPKNLSLEKAVKRYLHQYAIDLMVMGTKGRTGATDIFFGGNTIQMVKSNLDCPILCIPKQMDYKPIAQIAFISHFKNAAEKFSLALLKSLAVTHQAAMHVVHIDKDEGLGKTQEKNKEVLARFFEDTCPQFHTIALEKSKAKTVARFSQLHEINLLAMCYSPHYLLDKLFREPVVLDLSIYSQIPLIILPIQV